MPASARRAWCATLLACLLAAASASAAAGPAALSPPQQVIERVSNDLKRVLQTDRARLATDRAYLRRMVDTLFIPNLDLDGLTRLVLGPYGRDATAAQRAAFIAAFKDLVINTYAYAVQEIGPWEVRYLPMRPGERADRVTVRTMVLQPRGQPVAVNYRMVARAGRWLAYDVLVEGVSLLGSYRNAFTGIARERGLDGLIAELQRRNATAPGD